MTKNAILFVDDEVSILNAIRRITTDEVYEFFYTTSPRDALDILEKMNISVLVTDLNMPEIDGSQLLKQVKTQYPSVVRIILTGETELAQVLTAVNDGNIFQFITKPWVEETFLSVLKQAVDYYNLCREKEFLEASLRQRNDAYTKMLNKMENEFVLKKNEFIHVKEIYIKITDYLLQELKAEKGELSADIAGQLIRQIIDDYLGLLPMAAIRFTVSNLITGLNRNFKEQLVMDDGSTFEAALECSGNLNLILLTVNAMFSFLATAEPDRKFKYSLTIKENPDTVEFSVMIEVGYVDGVKALIKKDAALTKGNLDFCAWMLNLLGKKQNIHTTTTYINQNASLVTIVANVSPSGK